MFDGIGWKSLSKALDKDANPYTRKIREAIQIRKRGAAALNRDDGAFHLDHVYNPLLRVTTTSLPGYNVNKVGRKSSGPVHL